MLYYVIFGGQYYIVFFLMFFMLLKMFEIRVFFSLKPIFIVLIYTFLAGTIYNIIIIVQSLGLSDMVALSTVYAVVILVVFVLVFIKGNRTSAIISALNYIMMSATSHYLVGYTNLAIMYSTPADWGIKLLNNYPWLYSIFTTSVTIIMHILITIFLIWNPIKFSFSKRSYKVLSLMVPIVYFVILFALKQQFNNIPVTLTPVLLMICLLLIIFFYFICTKLLKEYQEKVNSQILNRQMNLQLQYVKDIANSDKQLNKLNHDFKNHILYMDWLIEEKKYDELEKYFKSISKEFAKSKNVIKSENTLINAVLNPKISDAISKGIDVSAYVSVPSEIPIEENHLCALILNLFDNAMEASTKIPDGQIKVDIRYEKSYLYIEFSNKIKKNILEENPNLHTTKANKTTHGMGIKIIEEIIDTYNGVIDFKVEGDFFVANGILNCKQITINNINSNKFI